MNTILRSLTLLPKVDLNPIRAKVVDRPELCQHTSIRRQRRARQGYQAQQKLRSAGHTHQASQVAEKADLRALPKHEEDGLWLVPLRKCVSGPPDQPAASPLSSDDYITLVDIAGKIMRELCVVPVMDFGIGIRG